MPRKIRQLKADLRKAGFVEQRRRGKGSHSRWYDPLFPSNFVVLAGHDGGDAKPYQEDDVRELSNWRTLTETEVIMNSDVQYLDVRDEDEAAARRYAQIIEWSPDDDAFIVSVPDIPGLRTHGSTLEKAAAMANEAITLWLAGARATGIVPPSPVFSARHIAVARSSESERVRQIRQNLEVSQREFADMLNVSVATVRSWEQGLRKPDGASRRLIDIAERQPNVLLEVTAPSRESLPKTG